MIACLTGSLLEKTTERIIIDVGGVGYDVAFCKSGLGQLPEVGEDVFVHIYTKVREDAIELFGFINREEKELFVVLMGFKITVCWYIQTQNINPTNARKNTYGIQS